MEVRRESILDIEDSQDKGMEMGDEMSCSILVYLLSLNPDQVH